MGLLSFVKEAGAKLFGSKEEEEKVIAKAKADHLLSSIRRFNLRSDDVTATLRGETLILEGKADTLQEKNRIIMAMGNIQGIAHVDDRIAVAEAAPAAPENQFYTVKSGDSLSKIAREVYGDSGRYNEIFEANRPMLDHPDKIYPGQTLVIPA